MRDNERRKLDKYERELAYIKANAADYAKNSPADKIIVQFADAIAQVKTLAAQQFTGADGKAQHIDAKADYLQDLKDLMKMLDRAADALGDEVEGIENIFGLPRNRSEQSLLAAARAQYEAAAKYEKQLIEYDLPADFRAEMKTAIENIETANANADVSNTIGTGATSGLKALMSNLGAMSKKLDSVNRNKHRNNPTKLGAWITASHLERAPKTDKTVQPKPPLT